MCGRFALVAAHDDVARQFAVDDVVADPAPPRYNITPSQAVTAVAASSDGTRRLLGTFRWGLIPSWAKDPSVGNRLVNARVETLATRPAFRAAYTRRRCLIPASGYYEWKAATAGPGGSRRAPKIPYYFHRGDGLLLALAGLWEVWHGPDGHIVRSCAIVTTDADALNATVHDRMPLIVPSSLWARWLAPEPFNAADGAGALASALDDALVADQVGTLVNNPRNDGPELIEPVPS